MNSAYRTAFQGDYVGICKPHALVSVGAANEFMTSWSGAAYSLWFTV